jgi:hypothetical protein
VEFDGSGDEVGSWVGGAAGGVAQAGAGGCDWGGAVWAVADDPVGYVGEEELEDDRFCRHLNYAARATSLSIPSSYSTGVR